MRFFARLRNLVSGLLGQWIGRREHKNPGAIYEAARILSNNKKANMLAMAQSRLLLADLAARNSNLDPICETPPSVGNP